ncbi:MAG: PAS domain-containing sensor histidine kinase [Kordiimonadaceae bacterium]|nr:PAS domain-containing sensor histidine kinase [Kordiimonadaceae bacterium]MBO6570282.1 PAS domain-containing sensor histidine kinase [Kordiimonadaceae bacterium]MBO6965620.1 PAS domain-containing sensor histidine kinase [Kordiimonadaceae bacterium]
MSASKRHTRPNVMDASPKLPNRRWAKFMLWSRKLNLMSRLEVLLAFLAVASAVATYIAMSQRPSLSEVTSGQTMRVLLIVNLALLLALGVAIGRWFVRIWTARKGMKAGSRLQTRVTSFFIGIAIVPPIIMTVFSALFLEFGIQSWFSEKVRFTLNNSLEVAETYLIEHRVNIEKDMLTIAFAFNQLNFAQQRDNVTLQRVAETALTTRILSEVVIIQQLEGEDGNILAGANDGFSFSTPQIERTFLTRAASGETVVSTNQDRNSVSGLIKLTSFFQPTYLYVSRDLSPQVLGYLDATRSAVEDYENLEGQRSEFQLQFNVVFIIVALLILLAAIWIGLWFSSRLVNPLSNLVDAADRVGQGDLQARVPTVPSGDEVGTLSRAFNRMTDQLAKHQDALIEANNELDERRRFLEEVLEGVSAGVMGLQKDRSVFLPNRSSLSLLGLRPEDLMGKELTNVVPEFLDIVEESEQAEEGEAKGEVQLEIEGEIRTLMVRVFAERQESGAIGGYVVTFDDLTEQLADQRTAAWADVARRIAHEIKNPLTPIQLSAERLKRKYAKDIADDSGVFGQCTDTIIRQVGDLRRMVDEFSSFSRMPAPLYRETDIADVARQSVFLQEVAAPDIQFTAEIDERLELIKCDGRLVGQALTNVLKNAAEAVEARVSKDKLDGGDTLEPGFVRLSLMQADDKTIIRVEDNGLGLPAAQKDRLMEPYVTTRSKGTGLGLAIVRRIMEEHGGSVRIADRSPIGARVVLTFSHQTLERRAEQAENNQEAESHPAAAE